MSTAIRKVRRPPGEIRDAILRFLRERASPATVAEIESSVGTALEGNVSSSSVRSYLRLNNPRVFQKVEEGVYSLPEYTNALRSAAEPAPAPAYVYNRSTLYHHNCLDWLAQREPRSIHAVVTDPPYGLLEYSEVEQNKLRSGKGGVWRIPPSFDGHQRAPLPRFTVLDREQIGQLRRFFRRWTEALLPVLVPGAHVFLASNPLLSYAIADELADAGLERRGEIIRLTMTMRGGDRPKNAHEEFVDVSVMPRSMWEPWLLFRKPIEGRVQDNLRKWNTGGLRRLSQERPFGDVIKSSPTQARERLLAPHPSLKPQAFLRQIVRASLPLGKGIVLDPFAGSGSTLAACEATGYQSIGVELDHQYVDLAKSAIPKLAAFVINDQTLYTHD